MSDIIIRRFEPKDREGFARVRSLTYRGGEQVPPDEDLLKDDCLGYLAERDGQIVGAFTALKMTCAVDGTHLSCAGVAAVAVNPELRKSGVGSALMAGGLRLLKEDGFALASLYPYRETYYRRFGYEACGGRFKITVPGHRMPHIEAPLSIRMLSGIEDWKEIAACYEEFAIRYNGTNRRGERMWWRVLGGDTPFTVYAMGDPIEAYAAVRLKVDFWEPQEVKEVAWTTREGYESLLAMLGQLGINKSEVSWNEPTNSPFVTAFLDQGVKISNERFVMYRALDPVTILKARKPIGSGSFGFNLEDEQLPENSGAYQVEFTESGTSVWRGGGGPVSSVQTFTQFALGEPSYRSLSLNGFVVNDESAERFFAPRHVYCPDAF